MPVKFFKKRKYINPFVPNKSEPHRQNIRNKKGFFLILILVIGIFFLFYTFFFSGLLSIRRIKIEGTQNSRIINGLRLSVLAEKNGYYYGFLPKDNLWLLNLNDLNYKIKKNFLLDRLDLDKEIDGTLVVKVKVKKPVLVWRDNKIYYYVDYQGVIMGAKKESEIEFNLPLVEGVNEGDVIVGRKILDSQLVHFISQVWQRVNKDFDNWHITYIKIPQRDATKIFFYTDQDWYFILDRQSNIKIALENLALILKSKLIHPEIIDYIDLRIQDKIFYKLKN